MWPLQFFEVAEFSCKTWWKWTFCAVLKHIQKKFSFALVSPLYIYINMYTSIRNVWKHSGSLSTSVGLLYVDRWRQQFCRCSSAAEGQHVGFRLCKCKGSYLEVRCQVCCFMRIVLLVGELDLFHLLRWVNLISSSECGCMGLEARKVQFAHIY